MQDDDAISCVAGGHRRMVRTADGSSTIHSSCFGETYHSVHGAVAESRHVFVELSGVAGRLARGERVRVLEVGFGTGLNLVTSAVAAHVPGALLDYVGCERHPLPWAEVSQLGYGAQLPEAWRDGYAEAVRGLAASAEGGDWEGVWRDGGGEVRVQLRRDDIRAALEGASGSLGCAGSQGGPAVPEGASSAVCRDAAVPEGALRRFDVIYHDAFSPGACPELWTTAFFEQLGGVAAEGAVMVTFSCAGRVRRALREAGWAPEKSPGPPGGKREVLRAVWRG